MRLNDVTKMGIIFEPLVFLFLREPLIPEREKQNNESIKFSRSSEK
jgi:hypothetical protein